VKQRPLLAFLAVCVVLGTTIGCAQPADTPATSPAAGPVVAVIVASSGPASFIGRPEEQVLRLLIDDLEAAGRNPHGATFELSDSAGDPARARELFDRYAADDRVIAIIGPSTSGEAIPLAERASEEGIPLLSLAASRRIVLDDAGNVRPFAFKFAQNDDLAARQLVDTMGAEQHRRVALLYSDDPYGQSGAQVFGEAAAESPVEVVHQAAFPPALDAAGPLVAGLPASLDAVVVWGTAPGPAMLVQSLAASRPGLQIYLSPGDASPELIEAAGSAAEGVIIAGSRVLAGDRFLDPADPRDDVIRSYRSLWEERIGGAPSQFGGHAHDAFNALLQALDEEVLAGDVATRRRNLRDRLEQISNFHGITGTFTFTPTDHAGLGLDAYEVYRIRDGAFVPYASSLEGAPAGGAQR